MQEQKFKDLSSSKCLLRVGGMLHLESWASGSILTGANILSLDFFVFHVIKRLMPILALLPILCICENPDFIFNTVVAAKRSGCDGLLDPLLDRHGRR